MLMFSLISYPLRYLNENFLQIWGTLVIDINDWTALSRRELGGDAKDYALTITAILLITAYSFGLLALVVLAVKQMSKPVS